ncbi:MAG TPA: SurA N-terminal domain-containing protein [Casimicrobiaceae bacterium]|jgi:peptidyl-prolyl cis-trans isomerase D|nr:SurA N-terminal domain-containing protein [Casimicrobiaceae bacterium]
MYDLIYRKKRLVQVILGLITLPFAFFGVDYYFRGGGSASEIARVGGDTISQADFANAIRDQQDRMRQSLGKDYDPSVFNNPEVRYSMLEQLVGQRVLDQEVRRSNLRVSDAQLAQFIGELPPFQEDGKFSRSRYEQLLTAQGMTPLAFEQRVRQELTLAPLQEPIANGNITAVSNVERYLGLLDQQRQVAVATVSGDAYLKDVKIDDAAVKAFYDANQGVFQVPDEVKIEYLVLTPQSLIGQITVDPAEVKKQYDDNVKQYTKAEERQASHILVAVKPDATDADKAAAKQKAEALAATARKTPAKFAELAKQNSQDPGSAGQGGDLGSFARDGSMVKPFEDAVFSGKQGDIVGPVQTDFGWHIIRITGVTPGKTQSFDEAKPQIEQDLKQSKATRKFVEAADQFQNLVYEQADSLQAAAKGLNLEVKTTPMLTRAQVQALAQNSAKFVQAVFSPESLQAKRNTEALEVAPNTLMAGRVIDYKPATTRPFDDVKVEIRRQLEQNAASELAQKTGKEKLALLEQGKDAGMSFGNPVTLTRNQAQPGFLPDALIKIFQANASKLPAYVGALAERGSFSIYKVIQVVTPPAPDPDRLKAFNNRIGDQVGHELFNAYLASLKSKADVKINQANLEKK